MFAWLKKLFGKAGKKDAAKVTKIVGDAAAKAGGTRSRGDEKKKTGSGGKF